MLLKRFLWIRVVLTVAILGLYAPNLNGEVISYDAIVEWIEAIENDDFDGMGSFSELNKKRNMLTFLAWAGLDRNDLDKAIALENSLAEDIDVQLFMLCGAFGDSWNKTKEFVTEYKKEILTGVGILITIAAAVLKGGDSSSGKANFVYHAPPSNVRIPESNPYGMPEKNSGETIAKSFDLDIAPFYGEYPGSPYAYASSDQSPEIVSFNTEMVSIYRDDVSKVVDAREPDYLEKIRGYGSTFAHEVLDGVDEIGSFAPGVLDDSKRIGNRFLPEGLEISPDLMNPSENYQKIIAAGHEKIDRFFATNQAEQYTADNRTQDITIGGFPPPTITNAGRATEIYNEALKGGRHVKFVRDYLGKRTKELKKGIVSYEKQIAIHRDKIADPLKHYPNWYELEVIERNALIDEKWPSDIKRLSEQRDILQSILNERLQN